MPKSRPPINDLEVNQQQAVHAEITKLDQKESKKGTSALTVLATLNATDCFLQGSDTESNGGVLCTICSEKEPPDCPEIVFYIPTAPLEVILAHVSMYVTLVPPRIRIFCGANSVFLHTPFVIAKLAE